MSGQLADDPMLPSLFRSEEDVRLWSVARAALYGAGIGFVAALIKAFGPFHVVDRVLPLALDIGVAVLAFTLLCAGAALLRNLLMRRLQDPAPRQRRTLR
jgi:hypothetical protein